MNFHELIGHTIHAIHGAEEGSESVELLLTGVLVLMQHSPDCCESVQVHQIDGDINDLIESPILHAEEASNSDDAPPESYESHTWTFYHLRTQKGSVTIRWLGTSNGYYSERVDLAVRKLDMEEYAARLPQPKGPT